MGRDKEKKFYFYVDVRFTSQMLSWVTEREEGEQNLIPIKREMARKSQTKGILNLHFALMPS